MYEKDFRYSFSTFWEWGDQKERGGDGPCCSLILHWLAVSWGPQLLCKIAQFLALPSFEGCCKVRWKYSLIACYAGVFIDKLMEFARNSAKCYLECGVKSSTVPGLWNARFGNISLEKRRKQQRQKSSSLFSIGIYFSSLKQYNACFSGSDLLSLFFGVSLCLCNAPDELHCTSNEGLESFYAGRRTPVSAGKCKAVWNQPSMWSNMWQAFC